MKSVYKISLILIVVFSIFACGRIARNEVAGVYGSDKFVLRDNSQHFGPSELIISEDGLFEFSECRGTRIEKGIWEILESDADSALLQFMFGNTKITGTLRGSIIYFEYPNDFNGGSFSSILYVRTIQHK